MKKSTTKAEAKSPSSIKVSNNKRPSPPSKRLSVEGAERTRNTWIRAIRRAREEFAETHTGETLVGFVGLGKGEKGVELLRRVRVIHARILMGVYDQEGYDYLGIDGDIAVRAPPLKKQVTAE